jgi:hypothetical protein
MTMMMAPSKAVLAGKADAGEAADEVFPAGEPGDVAATALASPLDEQAVEAVEIPEARATSDDGDDTADASADTAVS